MKRNFKEIITNGIKLFYNDIKSAKWAIMLIVAYFAVFKNIFYSLCPLVILTGFPCPGCGLTRAGFKVLRLDFAGAWKIHPFIFAVIILVVVFISERYIFQKKRMTLSMWCAVFIITGMVLFYIWRMMNYFPEVPPMTYYRHNLLNNIRLCFLK